MEYGGQWFRSLQIHSGRTAPTVGWLLSNASQVLHWTHPRSVTSSPAFSLLWLKVQTPIFLDPSSEQQVFLQGNIWRCSAESDVNEGFPWRFNSPQFYYLSILWDILGHLVLHLKAQTKVSKSFQLYTNVIPMTAADMFPEVYKLSNFVFIYMAIK